MITRLIKLQQIAQYWQHRIGWMTIAGFLLMVYAVLFYATLGFSADQRLKYMKANLTQMRSAIVERQQNARAESPQSTLQTFYHLLPPVQTAPDLLKKIFSAAEDNDLFVEKGEFKLAQDKDAAFVRYEVALPVSGSYPNIRKFVNRVLREMPSAMLENISFSREDVHDAEVQAKVQFVLLMGIKR